jgi:hypothetical protein
VGERRRSPFEMNRGWGRRPPPRTPVARTRRSWSRPWRSVSTDPRDSRRGCRGFRRRRRAVLLRRGCLPGLRRDGRPPGRRCRCRGWWRRSSSLGRGHACCEVDADLEVARVGKRLAGQRVAEGSVGVDVRDDFEGGSLVVVEGDGCSLEVELAVDPEALAGQVLGDGAMDRRVRRRRWRRSGCRGADERDDGERGDCHELAHGSPFPMWRP